jgi:predicted phage gp36 major capsid-like protein
MVNQRITKISLGAEQLIFDNNAFTNKSVRQLRLDLEKCVADFQKEEDDRINEIQSSLEKFAEDCKKKEKESDKAHKDRVAKLTEELKEKTKAPEDYYWLQELAFRLLKVLASVPGVNQVAKVTKENFDEAPWEPMKEELAKLLYTHGLEGVGSSFLPPKLTEDA